jgi:hypothetical protein
VPPPPPPSPYIILLLLQLHVFIVDAYNIIYERYSLTVVAAVVARRHVATHRIKYIILLYIRRTSSHRPGQTAPFRNYCRPYARRIDCFQTRGQRARNSRNCFVRIVRDNNIVMCPYNTSISRLRRTRSRRK